ncbi:MAG: polymer-forming cytoskeletal protein [Lautropia sp.]
MASGAARLPTGSTQVGAGTIVDGSLTFSGHLLVDGTVVGPVRASPLSGSELRVGPNGVVAGGACVETIVVAGRLAGTIHAERRLEVLPGAVVDGQLRYRDLQIHHGACVVGSLAAIDGDEGVLKIAATRRGA